MSDQDHMRERIADLESCVALQRQVISAYRDAAVALRQVAEKPIPVRKEHWAVDMLRAVLLNATEHNECCYAVPSDVMAGVKRELERYEMRGGDDG